MNELSTANAISQLGAPDKDVRVAAALHLGKVADASSVDALLRALAAEPELYVRETLTWALVRLGHTAVAPLIQMLASSDPAWRNHAAHVIGKMGADDAVDSLIQTLADTDATVRMKATLSLGQIGNPKTIPFLIQRFGDADSMVQSTVNTALEQFGAAAIDPLIGALHDSREWVRKQAAEVLGLLANDRATPALAQLLTDEHAEVRFAAMSALHDIGSPSARRAMRTAINDADVRVRALAGRG